MDLQRNGRLRSLYTGQEWEPEQLIRADLAIARDRARELTSRLRTRGARSAAEVRADVEAALPLNCEHVVPRSWFARKEPMRGDLHHLFACETRCNGFRANTPFVEFADFPEPGDRVVRGECGKGAAARAVFSFLLRYPRAVDDREMPPDRHEMLVGWHEQDPVTEWERHRNAAIFERQGNRNPFIDHPDLARRLLPEMTSPGRR